MEITISGQVHRLSMSDVKFRYRRTDEPHRSHRHGLNLIVSLEGWRDHGKEYPAELVIDLEEAQKLAEKLVDGLNEELRACYGELDKHKLFWEFIRERALQLNSGD
jgi:hypothetical protein